MLLQSVQDIEGDFQVIKCTCSDLWATTQRSKGSRYDLECVDVSSSESCDSNNVGEEGLLTKH